MSTNIEKMKADIQAIKKGLAMMGKDRRIALSVHKTYELIADMQATTEDLVKAIDELEK